MNVSGYITKQALCHENIRGIDVYIQVFLASALIWGEWSASRPGCSTPGERTQCTHWIRGQVSPKTCMDRTRTRTPTLRTSTHSQSLHRLVDTCRGPNCQEAVALQQRRSTISHSLSSHEVLYAHRCSKLSEIQLLTASYALRHVLIFATTWEHALKACFWFVNFCLFFIFSFTLALCDGKERFEAVHSA
jgi:hypothetical protein